MTMTKTEKFGNGLEITIEDDGLINVSHSECECNPGDACCLTAVDGKLFREAMERLLDPPRERRSGLALPIGTKELNCTNCGYGFIVPNRVAEITECINCRGWKEADK